MGYDFDLCMGQECPIKAKCKRYQPEVILSPQPYWVYYYEGMYRDNKCECFIEIVEKNERNKV